MIMDGLLFEDGENEKEGKKEYLHRLFPGSNELFFSSVHHNRPRWRQGYPRTGHDTRLVIAIFSFGE